MRFGLGLDGIWIWDGRRVRGSAWLDVGVGVGGGMRGRRVEGDVVVVGRGRRGKEMGGWVDGR